MKQVLMFSLDLFLDTRIATLSRIDSAVASAIITDPKSRQKYYDRLNDQFLDFGLTTGQFEKVYAKRDANLLPQSRPTPFLFELRDIALQLIKKAAMEPHMVDDVEFHVNFYPYHDLSREEQDSILAAIKSRVPDSIAFKGVYYPPEVISPEFIKSSHYTGLFFYDFTEWVNYHFGKDVKADQLVPIPSISIYTTLLFNDLEKLREAMEFKNPNGEQCSPMLGLRGLFAPYFYLEAIDIRALSIIEEKNFVERELES